MISIPRKLSIADVISVMKGERVSISVSAIVKMEKTRKTVEKFAESGERSYGINTGVGALLDKSLAKEELEEFQNNLIRSHAAGIPPWMFPVEVVRGAMFLKANELAKGYSGVRPDVAKKLVEVINNNSFDVLVPSKGSLGASGDLAPLAHVALFLIGEGTVSFRKERGIVKGKDAMKKTGIKPIKLKAKEALSLINGTQFMSSLGSLNVSMSESLVKSADIAAALTMEALNAKTRFLDRRIHDLKRFSGQSDSASNIRRLVNGSEIENGNKKVQDAYSLRCTPQVHGACREALRFAKTTVETEINSVTDNPLIFGGEIVSGGNFHGQTIAMAMDFLGIAMTELSSISERRTNRLLDEKLSGLPAFLAKRGGINSGFMVAHYTSAYIVSENRVMASPSSIDSIPVSANQEDFVSMGMLASNKARDIIFNSQKALAIEMLAACQGIDVSGRRCGKGTRKAFEFVRKTIPKLEDDRSMEMDIMETSVFLNNIFSSPLVKGVEEVAGKLL